MDSYEKPQEVAQTKHMIDRAGRVGVTLADFQGAFMMQQAIQNMRGLAGVRRDDLGVKRRVAIGDMRVELHAGFRSVFAVVIGAGSPCPPALKNWPSDDDVSPSPQIFVKGCAWIASTKQARPD